MEFDCIIPDHCLSFYFMLLPGTGYFPVYEFSTLLTFQTRLFQVIFLFDKIKTMNFLNQRDNNR